MKESDIKLIAEKFQMPKEAYHLLDFFFTDEDQSFILEFPNEAVKAEDIEKSYLADAFQRGIINKTDESGSSYVLNNFYGMLDVFSVSQTEKYRSLPKEDRQALDKWYFNCYVDSLDKDLSKRPTADQVISLDEMLEFIDKDSRQMYLSNCDCKSLNGDCNVPLRTCINFEPGTNGFVKRGISSAITKEEAKEVIRMADASGLMHTISSHGICNCCDDCCYLFRAQKERGSVGYWPKSDHLIFMDKDKCISCGKCTMRCRFKVFTKEGQGKEAHITADRFKCVGCGLCATTCPTKALSLKDRPKEFIQINGQFGA